MKRKSATPEVDASDVHCSGSPDIFLGAPEINDTSAPLARKLEFNDSIEDEFQDFTTVDDGLSPARPPKFDDEYRSSDSPQSKPLSNGPSVDFRSIASQQKIDKLQRGTSPLSPNDSWYIQQPWSVRSRIVERFFIDSEAKCVKLHDEEKDAEACVVRLKVEKANLKQQLESIKKEHHRSQLSLKKVLLLLL